MTRVTLAKMLQPQISDEGHVTNVDERAAVVRFFVGVERSVFIHVLAMEVASKRITHALQSMAWPCETS